MKKKPIKVKPSFYSLCFHDMKKMCKKYGYNLVLHGSLNRDMDIIAIPWKDNIKITHNELLKKIRDLLGGTEIKKPNGDDEFYHSILPGGRDSYIIYLNHGYNFLGDWTNDVWYIDISFTPLMVKK